MQQRRKLRTVLGLFIFSFVLLSSAIAQGALLPEKYEPVVSANTCFGTRLVQKLLSGAGEKNLFISPYSILSALALTSNGASGVTLDVIQQVLGLRETGERNVNTGFELLNESLCHASGEIELSVANSLWAREDIVFVQDFLDKAHSYYAAHVARVDFLDSSAPDMINGWVHEKTRGKIENIVDGIDPLSILFIVNAVYFQGNWTRPFDPALTSQMVFHSPSGVVKNHPMMRRAGRYHYLEAAGFQVVRIPYGCEEEMSLYAFLPEESRTLTSFVQGLSGESLTDWISDMEPMQGTLAFPRFTVSYEVNLKDVLVALGMGVAFDPNEADFQRMTQLQAWINKVKHKAALQIDEKGSEAAAATSVEMRVTSVARDTFSIVFDRPFFYLIRDDQTGVVLFCGMFVEPA